MDHAIRAEHNASAKMIKHLLINSAFCALFIFPMYAHADDWTGQDKLNHMALSASVSKLTTQTHSTAQGIALALLPGMAKELSDLSGSGTSSLKDMSANIVGALIGAALPKNYMILPIAPMGVINGVFLTYSMDL